MTSTSKPTSTRAARILATIATSAVVAAVVTALFILGPPKHQRQRKLDDRRIQDLMSIEYTMDSYWRHHKKLPPDISTLSQEPGFDTHTMDPERGQPYELEITAPDSYRLCAVFALDSAESPQTWGHSPSGEWAHGAGRRCFDRKAPKDDSN